MKTPGLQSATFTPSPYFSIADISALSYEWGGTVTFPQVLKCVTWRIDYHLELLMSPQAPQYPTSFTASFCENQQTLPSVTTPSIEVLKLNGKRRMTTLQAKIQFMSSDHHMYICEGKKFTRSCHISHAQESIGASPKS